MSEATKIEWCDSTFNPWIGCQKVSPACDNCYAEALMSKRLGRVEWGPGKSRKRTSPANWNEPRKWNRDADAFKAENGRPRFVFCASLADVFDNAVPKEWREDLWDLIRETPRLVWLLLTKRPQNIAKMLPNDWGDGWPNVWLGTTVEDQARANLNIPPLLDVPAAQRFLSCEPLLERVDLSEIIAPKAWGENPDGWLFDCRETGDIYRINYGKDGFGKPCWDISDGPYRETKIDWVICGGESGAGARPMRLEWARCLRDQCTAAGVPFFFKQWGEYCPFRVDDPEHQSRAPRTVVLDEIYMVRMGSQRTGRKLDGRTWDERPEALRPC